MDEKRMLVSEHIKELRSRVIICLVAVLMCMIVAYFYCPDVFYPIIRAPLDAVQGNAGDNPFVLKTPLLEMLVRSRQDNASQPGERGAGPVTRLHYLSLTVPFVIRLKVSLVVGIILALPVLVYEIWAFVSTGLHDNERRHVLWYAPASFVLFLAGAGLAYFIVLPVGVAFLLKQGDAFGLRAVLTINEYAPLVMWLLLGFGIIFQTPLVVLFLTRVGLVGPDALARSRRVAILVVFIIAALLTPPDPFTQIAMAIPLIGLYEFSILLSRFAVRKRKAAS